MALKLKGVDIPKEYRDFIEFDKKNKKRDVIGVYKDYSLEFIEGFDKWFHELSIENQKKINEYVYS